MSATQSQLSVVDSVEGFVMDTFCIERGTLLDKPDVVTLEGPDQHSFHWYVGPLQLDVCIENP
jgi:hypothetical protein